jgi:glycine cleavage system transcriptional repressor
MDMKKYMILVCVGKDRPGIVEDLSNILFEHNANIEDSRAAVMGGRFSVMILFSCTLEELEQIGTDMQALEPLGLKATLHEADDPAALAAEPALPLILEATSMDHPGIVQKMVRILRRHDVNILVLNTKVTQAPFSGAPLFNLNLEAAVPMHTPIAQVKAKLLELAAELNLDLNFQ